MTKTELPVHSGKRVAREQVSTPELSAQSCLEGLGISLLSEWDVLNFMYRHRVSLMSADRIAHLIGYEGAVVRSALDRLQREKLVERSRASQGVRFYRILGSTDARRGDCFRQLILLSRSRAGRLLLAEQLKRVRPKLGLVEPSAKSKR